MKYVLTFTIAILLVSPISVYADSQYRVKLSTEISDLWSNAKVRSEADPRTQGLLNFRYLWTKSSDRWAFDVQFMAELNYVPERERNPWLRSVPQIVAQERAFWTLHDDEQSTLLAVIDRAQVIYKNKALRVSFGRFPNSWGRGLVFHPLDVFNAYEPTRVDRAFKRGNDSLLVEYLFGSGSELQVLSTVRDRLEEFHRPTTTYALKYYLPLGDAEFDTVLAIHYGDSIYGFSSAIPVLDFLIRVDVSHTCVYKGSCKASGIVNLDYTFNLGRNLVYAFGEYYRNGLGVSDLSLGYSALPKDLTRRLGRGELFSMGKNLFAFGASIAWHPLLSQTFTVLTNADDTSSLLQTFVSFTPSDHASLNFGVRLPFGDTNEEFGELIVNDHSVVGGVSGIFGEFIYHR